MTPNQADDELHNALHNNELVYYYQPKVNLLRGQVSGIEALIRWVKPDGTVISPNSFIPLAEASGKICDVSLSMLDKLTEDFIQIQKVKSDFIMSFNLTAKDFTAEDFVKKWYSLIAAGKLNPRRFQIEITETLLIDSSKAVQKNIQAIADTGVSLAMDDLGTGQSTLDVLSKWPFTAVKIDQGLIRRMHHDTKNATIVRNTIYMAHQLGLKIIAEGIETEEAYNFLLTSGCTEAQGYYISPPMPLQELIHFLEEERRWPASPVGLIQMAQSDHLQWRRQLTDYTVSKLYDFPILGTLGPEHIEDNPHHCLLGQWYYGLGRNYAGNAAYDALEAPHNQLHELGQKIQQAIENAAPRAEIISLLRYMTELSSEIIHLLQKLELDALLEKEANH